ncbi:MAG: hypothetical protein P8Z77_03025 [Candidatus Thiodiazotropha sp.]
MKVALFFHLVFVSAWMSCIFVEVLYERSIDQSEAMRRFVSKLHWNTDKFVEAPAFIGVLISGTVDHKQHHYGAVVLVTLLIALVIGGYLFSVGY